MNRFSQQIQLKGLIYNNENIYSLHIENEEENSWRNAIYHFLKNWFDETDFIITHTSGSTGIPKEIRLAKTSMRNSAQMTNAFFELDETKTALLCLPASYIAGKMMLVRAIVGGFNLVTVEPKANPFENLEIPIDFTAITPYQLHYSIDALKQKKVKNIIVGGGHVNFKLEALAETIPSSMFETYGMTETCSHIALRQFNGIEKSDVFSILKGVTIRQNEQDCLVISAPHLFENEIITNDIVEIIDDSSFRWLGRIDSTINSGGIKIYPELVEKKLESIITSNFFISSIADEVYENQIVLIIETQ
jgi:O-succinylbenzoic acid--CoA ligase